MDFFKLMCYVVMYYYMEKLNFIPARRDRFPPVPWPTADIRFFFNFIFLFILFYFRFILLFFSFLFFFLSFFYFYYFHFHFFISFHFTSISLFETKSNEMKIKSKRDQKKTTWPRADIAPKINHDGRELT